jgi:anti-sigma factor RsiW
MEHFNQKDWIDFVRGTLSQERERAIRNHLDSGCIACAEEKQAWAWMREFGTQEAGYEPPANALRIAKTALSGRAKEPRHVMKELAELVFDTYSQPQVVGVRSTTAAPRQLLYRAGALMIDMRLQTVGDPERFALMGQVLTAGEKKHALRQVPVQLLSGTEELASTSTNQFGEFYLEHKAGRDLQISLGVSNEKLVFIPLDESIWRVARSQ